MNNNENFVINFFGIKMVKTKSEITSSFFSFTLLTVTIRDGSDPINVHISGLERGYMIQLVYNCI